MIKTTEVHYLQFTVEGSFTREDFEDLLKSVDPDMQAMELQVSPEVGRNIALLTRDAEGKPATLPTNQLRPGGQVLRIPITPSNAVGVNRLMLQRWTPDIKASQLIPLSNELHAYLELMVKHDTVQPGTLDVYTGGDLRERVKGMELELRDYANTVQPGTLGSALENMLKTPHAILAGWFGIDDDDARIATVIKELETLVLVHGATTKLADIEAMDHPSYSEDRLYRLAAKDNFIGAQLVTHTPEEVFNTYVRGDSAMEDAYRRA